MTDRPVQVLALDGMKEDFFRRHRKDEARATIVWQALLAKAPVLQRDSGLGELIRRDRVPRRFQGLSTLRRLALPHGFRALYTVFHMSDESLVVRIDWIGDHKEYDRLFGYSTS